MRASVLTNHDMRVRGAATKRQCWGSFAGDKPF
jgi:hypothetical protein